MTNVLLHIGMGKSGSSALQKFLSMSPEKYLVKESPYDKIQYIAINRYGKIYSGEELKYLSKITPHGYSKSADMQYLHKLDEENVIKLKKILQQVSKGGKVLPVLSSEDWHLKAKKFSAHKLFHRLDIAPSAICYVRNPVELINSAWWQWHAWSSIPFNKFIHMWIEKFKILPESLEYWNTICKGNLTVVALPSDIISDFCKRVGISDIPDQMIKNNVSLPAEVLRFYQRFPDLRSSLGSTLDFILTKHISFNETYHKTPWVLSNKTIEKILKETNPAIKQIAKMFDSDSLYRYENDAKWHSVEAFSNKKYSSPTYSSNMLDKEMLEQMLYDTIYSFVELEKKYKKSRIKLMKILNDTT